MHTYTTEIASDKLSSDNPIHQRLLSAYVQAQPFLKGKLLEVGCGEGRGVEWLAPKVTAYTGIDKIGSVVDQLKVSFPHHQFQQAHIPPFPFDTESFDTVVSFQVIEHIALDKLFLEEIYRVLKPGGQAIISTPNIRHTLSRNPWHVREYTPKELERLCRAVFPKVQTLGIGGNEKVWAYHEENRKSVQRIMRFDIFNLQYRLPADWLKVPYEFLNRRNRSKLQKRVAHAVELSYQDFHLVESPDQGLDLYYILEK
ncbi:MAG: class I SAM-dependent methyltransferase [Nitritalea sp.]